MFASSRSAPCWICRGFTRPVRSSASSTSIPRTLAGKEKGSRAQSQQAKR